MKRLTLITALLAIFALWCGTSTATAAASGMTHSFSNESLRYKVQYKWGLISKVAGYVSIKLNNKDDRYKCELTAASASWADGLYKVRDTLRCEILKDGFKPVIYEKMAHEGGSSGHDVVRYTRSGNTVTGHCTRRAWKKGEETKNETRVLEAEGVTLDMFSAFYYMRTLPYSTWTKGTDLKLNIFSGKKKEILTIVYHGIEEVKYDKQKYTCYHITFRFTSDDGKKSSDDMDAWITTDKSHIPVKLVGNLPVGKVKCYYLP